LHVPLINITAMTMMMMMMMMIIIIIIIIKIRAVNTALAYPSTPSPPSKKSWQAALFQVKSLFILYSVFSDWTSLLNGTNGPTS